MTDPAAAYRASQVLTASPVERVVLLYRGAIRFAFQAIDETEKGNRETSNRASLRSQEIVSALRATLDMSAGPIATNLDSLYAFCLARLTDGNIHRDPKPVREAITVLQGLLEAWQQIAQNSNGTVVPAQSAAPAGPLPAARAGFQPVGATGSATTLRGGAQAARMAAYSGSVR